MREEKPKLSAKDRLCLIQTINALPPTQFDELVFALSPPKGVVASSNAPQGVRSRELLDWLEGSRGPGLAAADEVLQVLIPKATKTAPQSMAFVMSGKVSNSTAAELQAFVELLRQKTGDTSLSLHKDDRIATSPDPLTLHRYKRTNKAYVEYLGDGVSLTLMLIPGGEFMMGAQEHELGIRDSERPQRLVKVPPFLIGRYPVTQAQWRVVAGYDREDRDLKPNPSRFKGDDLPVEQVSWYDATEFCKRLSAKTQKNYLLPSEAQWEYACRAETTAAYHFGDQLTTELANYASSGGQTTVVGTYPANRWGLHDMHGNVWEWCQDHWDRNYEGSPDAGAWVEGSNFKYRVRRGGAWNDDPRYCRSAYRNSNEPGDGFNFIGFRVCCLVPRTL